MTLPIVAVLAILVVPGRGRTIAAFAAVGAAILLIMDPLLDVYSELPPAGPARSRLRQCAACAAARLRGTHRCRRPGRGGRPNAFRISAARARGISAATVVAVALATVAVVAGYAIVERNPVSASADAWDEFKQGGYSPTERSSRLSAGFSTYRYDYWRVAWGEFEDAPLLGAGADNFGRAYLRQGESPQRPRFPHSTEMVALAETGVVGALLLGAAFVCALLAALPGRRGADLGAAASGAGRAHVRVLARARVARPLLGVPGARGRGTGGPRARHRGGARPERGRRAGGLPPRRPARARRRLRMLGAAGDLDRAAVAVRAGAAGGHRSRTGEPRARRSRDWTAPAKLNPLSPAPYKTAAARRDQARALRRRRR